MTECAKCGEETNVTIAGLCPGCWNGEGDDG